MKIIKNKISRILTWRRHSKNNRVAHSANIHKSAEMGGDCVIGEEVILGEDVTLSKGVRVGRGASLSRITVGDNSHIESWIVCTGHGDGKIRVGKECYIGLMNVLDFSSDLIIGDYVHIAGPSTGLWTHSTANMCIHNIPLSRLDDEEYRPRSPIVIEDNVYIGGNTTVYPGVTIHHHSIIAPNSAVTKDVEPYTVVGGVPSKLIKRIDAPGS